MYRDLKSKMIGRDSDRNVGTNTSRTWTDPLSGSHACTDVKDVNPPERPQSVISSQTPERGKSVTLPPNTF